MEIRFIALIGDEKEIRYILTLKKPKVQLKNKTANYLKKQ